MYYTLSEDSLINKRKNWINKINDLGKAAYKIIKNLTKGEKETLPKTKINDILLML